MIFIVENHLKSSIAYQIGKEYGHKNYLKEANFDLTLRKIEDNDLSVRKKVIKGLIKNVNNKIKYQYKKNNGMIIHFKDSHGYIPPWVLVNILSLGTLGKIYANMKKSDRKVIADTFVNNNIEKKFDEVEFSKMVVMLTSCRNKCAHDERLYDYRDKQQIKNHEIHHNLSIPLIDYKYVCGKNDLFSIVIVLRLLLNASYNRNFRVLVREIEDNLNKLSKKTRSYRH